MNQGGTPKKLDVEFFRSWLIYYQGLHTMLGSHTCAASFGSRSQLCRGAASSPSRSTAVVAAAGAARSSAPAAEGAIAGAAPAVAGAVAPADADWLLLLPRVGVEIRQRHCHEKNVWPPNE